MFKIIALDRLVIRHCRVNCISKSQHSSSIKEQPYYVE